jgi:zinc protease
MKLVFPNGPYGRLSGGSPESLAAITVADLRAFVQDAFARDNLVIGVVGDIDPKEVGPWLDRVFGKLPAKAAPLDVPKVALNLPGGVKVIDFTCRSRRSSSARPACRCTTRTISPPSS